MRNWRVRRVRKSCGAASQAAGVPPWGRALMPVLGWTREDGAEMSLDPAGKSACATVSAP